MGGVPLSLEKSILDRYDFVMFFSVFDDSMTGAFRQSYQARTKTAYIHVLMPGGHMGRADREVAARVYNDRNNATADWLDEVAFKQALIMEDRPWAFVDMYLRGNDFVPETLKFEREPTRDDLEYQVYIGDDRYYDSSNYRVRYEGGGTTSTVAAWFALAGLTAIVSLIPR
jgi:hypothetical protein